MANVGADLGRVLEQVGKDKGIEKAVLVEAVEQAMAHAAKKRYGLEREIEAKFNLDSGEVDFFEFKTVVEDDDVADEELQITLSEARAIDPEAQIGDSLGVQMKVESEEFGRIDAQTAKQIIIQKVRDAEREMIFNEYKDRRNELVTGIVRRFEKGNIIVDLGRAEAILPMREQIPGENYRVGDRIQAFFVDIRRSSRDPQIVLSRSHPGLLIKLFEMEVPEIYEGIVEIVTAAREPGARAKIGVRSRDRDVDPVGACVGVKGSRVQRVVQELRGEKIDIIPYDDEPARFVCNAIQPAQVSKVIIDEDNKTMEIIVPDDQLSLAIGKRGQNVRLAAQLTGWKIDVTSETKSLDRSRRAQESLGKIEGVDRGLAELLYKHGFRSARDVSEVDVESLLRVPGMDETRAQNIVGHSRLVAEQEEQEARDRILSKKATPEQLATLTDGQKKLLEVRGATVPVVLALSARGVLTAKDIVGAQLDVIAGAEDMGMKLARQIRAASQKYVDSGGVPQEDEEDMPRLRAPGPVGASSLAAEASAAAAPVVTGGSESELLRSARRLAETESAATDETKDE